MGARIPYEQKEPYRNLLRKRIAAKVDKAVEKIEDPIKRAIRQIGLREPFFGSSSESAFYNTALLTMAFSQVEAGRMSKDSLVDLLTEFDLICSAMRLMRKLWIPQAGAGSQSTEYALHRAMFDASGKVMKAYAEKIGNADDEGVPLGEETVFWWKE